MSRTGQRAAGQEAVIGARRTAFCRKVLHQEELSRESSSASARLRQRALPRLVTRSPVCKIQLHPSPSPTRSKSFLDYSMSVIISRALPDVRDGLKPSQRRILYAMHELSLYPPKKHVKCAKIVGDTSGNYHPHGEAVIYSTLVNMGQPWSMRETLIDAQGNFGSVEGDPPASMRYTEARMTHLGGADGGPGQGHRRFRAELRRASHGANRLPVGVPELPRQWRHRHRRRHGDQHAAAQSRRGHRRHLRADRQSGDHAAAS